MWKYPGDVRGSLSVKEGTLLGELASDNIVLEIGTFEGLSTICMAQLAKRVHSVDRHYGDAATGPAFTLAMLLANLDRYKVRHIVEVHVADSQSSLDLFRDAAVDFAFIDGSHDKRSAFNDIGQCCRIVKVGGKIAVHDYQWTGVRAALDEAGFRTPERLIDSLAVFSNQA